MLHGLQFIMAHVSDLPAARTFYTERLGFEVEMENPAFIQFKSAENGGAVYALGLPEGDHDAVELWWFIDDADAAHADLVARGVEIVSPPADEPFGRAFSIKDPAGQTLYLLQPRG